MNELPASSGTKTKSNAQHPSLLVKLPITIPNRAKGIRKTFQRAPKRTKRDVGNFQSKNTSLKKSNTKLQKRIESLSKELKIHRRTRALTGTSNKRKSKNSERKAKVVEFLEIEDNSTTIPGKKDHFKDQESREVKQKRVLTDYMQNLYEKFMLENPDVKVCRFAFYTMKPSNIEYYINETILGKMNEQCMEEVKYFNWKRVQDGEKIRWKEVEEKVSKTAFSDLFNKELTACRGQIQRVQTQYIEIRRLRKNLQDGNIMIWMDFAENYNCSAVEEIQSAY
ncbi:unnamed protein product [Mytilus coruscus]|uniref:Uncharacterized protein n=1 Tax=Mytilus coruscus TaxID=42192 RepID=A0A6J8BM57_MYTCO|nr:unnamed protein product [Mytilus coruscus]